MAALHARGAKSRANLKRGGRHGRSAQDRAGEAEARKISRKLVLNPRYQKALEAKLEDASLHPSMQATLWHYAFGKPKELVEQVNAVPVKIVHEYSE